MRPKIILIRHFLFVYVFLTANIYKAQEKLQNKKNFGLSGSVRSLEEIMVSSDNNNVSIEAYEKTLGNTRKYYLFNNAGNVILLGSKIENDSVIKNYESYVDTLGRYSKTIYYEKNRRYAEGRVFYNGAGDSALAISIYWNGDTAMFSKYYYGDNHKQNMRLNYIGSIKKLTEKWTFKYDQKGNKIQETMFWNHDGKDYVRTFKYDANNRIIEMHDWHGDYVYAYDIKGNRISISSYSEKKILDQKETFKYNASGIKIEENLYGLWGAHEYKYLYDDLGNKIKEIVPPQISTRMNLTRKATGSNKLILSVTMYITQ